MAFDQQLEADRIDGFNLFSAFVRVPLLVLGGILGGDGSSSCDDADGESLSKHAANIDDSAHGNSSDNHSDSQFHGMSADSLNRSNQSRRILSTSSTASSSSNSSSESTTESCHNKYEIKRKKRMSWSDESGLPLVYENDESVSHNEPHNSPYSRATGSLHKPTKSAMRKSRSIRQEADGLSNSVPIKSRYIPNMNPRTAGNGLVIPTRPYGRHTSGDKKLASNSAEMSPQWGWYINTTPPTPELYHSRSSLHTLPSAVPTKKNQSKKSDASNENDTQAQSSRCMSNAIDGKTCQNQVFQNLQNSTKTNPMGGWTSIPI
mmetsp:Transcript_13004/g.29961  ORF Transcript_13004/g.29961 Transcript_13004/m.29961 type:complete len:319 (+) Transcript_13004:261-1217(+)